jgi:hypothetical protein
VLRGESIRSIAFDFNDRGIVPSEAAGGQGRRCAACWSHRGSPGFASTTARWSAKRRGPRSSTAPPMIG